MSFCVTTEMLWPVMLKARVCSACCAKKKHDTSNPQNKSKVFNKEPYKRFRPEEFEDHYRASQHMNSAFHKLLLQKRALFREVLSIF